MIDHITMMMTMIFIHNIHYNSWKLEPLYYTKNMTSQLIEFSNPFEGYEEEEVWRICIDLKASQWIQVYFSIWWVTILSTQRLIWIKEWMDGWIKMDILILYKIAQI